MPRKGSGWRKILDLPPIDWALLAAERSNTGRRHTPKSIAKIKAGIAKRAKAKRKAAAKRREAAGRKPIRQAGRMGSVNALARLLAAMAPGEWFGRSDIQNLSGLKRGTVAGTIIVAERRGMLERTKNPAWTRQGGVECEFLYRKLDQPGLSADLDQQVTNDVGHQGQRGDASEGH